MKEELVNIRLEQGLHARPAALFVKKANSFACDVFVIKDGKSANGKSILGLMSLAAASKTDVIVRTDGQDEDLALVTLCEFLRQTREVEV